MEFLQEALDVSTQSDEKANENEKDMEESRGELCHHIGRVYGHLGKLDVALEYYMNALEIRHRIHGGVHEDIASTLNNIASIYDDQGNFELALEYYEKSLTVNMYLDRLMFRWQKHSIIWEYCTGNKVN